MSIIKNTVYYKKDVILKKYNGSYYINDVHVLLSNQEYFDSHKLNSLIIYIYFLKYMVISCLLQIFNLFYEYKLDENKYVAFARSQRTKNKLQKVFNFINIIEDNIEQHSSNIYQLGSRRTRFNIICKKYIKQCLKDYKEIKYIIEVNNLEKYSSIILLWFVKRIPYTVIYANAIENFMINYKLSVVYTGQMYDRFALIEDVYSKKYNKLLICVPHGIETLEKLPYGYVGNIFYCSSLMMSFKLNNLYLTNKFIYDEDIAKKMFKVNACKVLNDNINKKIIFFTQPFNKNLTVKIIKKIAIKLKNSKLFIKIHPDENENIYKIVNTTIIKDYDQAISGNICISFFSTILLEAIYNNSISISLIKILNKDYEKCNKYDFLADNRILKPSTIEELVEIINKNL